MTKECETCAGQGYIVVDRYHHDSSSPNGWSGTSDNKTCPDCHGEKYIEEVKE